MHYFGLPFKGLYSPALDLLAARRNFLNSCEGITIYLDGIKPLYQITYEHAIHPLPLFHITYLPKAPPFSLYHLLN